MGESAYILISEKGKCVMRNLISALLIGMVTFLVIGMSDNLSFNSFVDSLKLDEDLLVLSNSTEDLAKDEVLIGRVIDGDTVLVINNEGEEERVRLLLIDTPESVHPTKPEELFGKESSDYAKNYLKQGQKVVLERGDPEKDKYGRTLGYIFVDGINFNQHMIEKGYARVAYVYEPNTKYLDEFKKAEKKAREQRLNIWSIDGYVTDKGFDMSVVE